MKILNTEEFVLYGTDQHYNHKIFLAFIGHNYSFINYEIVCLPSKTPLINKKYKFIDLL